MDVTFHRCAGHTKIVDLAFSLITNPDIKKLVGEFKAIDQNNFGWTDVIDQGQWKFLHDAALFVVSSTIPPTQKGLQNRVVGTVRPICVEIQKWMDDHRYIEITDIEESFYWTYEGLIDREKTAKELVINQDLSIQNRFELACNYCFMHYVEGLWNLLSESEKRRYSGNHIQNSRIIDFWIKWVTAGAKREVLLSPDEDFDQLCFNAYYTNPVALKYFIQLLTTEDKDQYLTKIAKEKYLIPSMMRFCILEMDSNQKAEMFKKTPFKTLKCFLDFPWQSSFLLMALHMWSYLRETDFVYLIYFIIFERIVPEWNDYNYIELLTEFWIQSPNHFKKYVSRQHIFKVLNFIVSQMMVRGYLSMADLHNFLKGFILPDNTEEMYEKACRSC